MADKQEEQPTNKSKRKAFAVATVALAVGLALALAYYLLDRFTGTRKPQGIDPVENFDAARFSGRWHEIARLDHKFERGLTHVTADYGLRADGGLDVVNSGYDSVRRGWKEAEGRAYFVGAENVGQLRVSFFRPFYGSYVVFYLDEDYKHALVAGSDKSYLWILSRRPTLDDATKNALVAKAQAQGFDVSKLVSA